MLLAALFFDFSYNATLPSLSAHCVRFPCTLFTFHRYTTNVKNFDVLDSIASSLVSLICESSGGLTGATATAIDSTKVGTYTMQYIATNSHGLTSNPVHRTIEFYDTQGPTWKSAAGVVIPESSHAATIEIEAATNAATLFAANAPVAVDTCGGGKVVVQFSVTVASALSTDDATTLLCGLSSAAGGKLASDAAQAAENAQDLNLLVRACSRYQVKYDAVDDATNHAFFFQPVHVRDMIAPNTVVTGGDAQVVTAGPATPGRCGPLFHSNLCTDGYCNEDNGWCGVTYFHRDAQSSTAFDASDAVTKYPVVSTPGRCGPNFHNNFCESGFCNEDNGWCGSTAAHRDAQSSTAFDAKWRL